MSIYHSSIQTCLHGGRKVALTFPNKSPRVSAVSTFFRQAVKKVSDTVLKGPRTSANNKVQFIRGGEW